MGRLCVLARGYIGLTMDNQLKCCSDQIISRNMGFCDVVKVSFYLGYFDHIKQLLKKTCFCTVFDVSKTRYRIYIRQSGN